MCLERAPALKERKHPAGGASTGLQRASTDAVRGRGVAGGGIGARSCCKGPRGNGDRGTPAAGPHRSGGTDSRMRRLASVSRHLTSSASSRGTSRVALIVGAGDAIGSAVARRFAREDYVACVVRRKKDSLAKLVEEIEAECGKGKAVAFGCDARKEDQVVALIAEIEDKIGPIEVAVHNIGANVRFNITETTSQKHYKVWEMASFSAFLMGREVAKVMKPRARGTICFTGATASVRAKEGFASFAGAKHSKRALASAMAKELWPEGIHVCHTVIDGPVVTEFVKGIIGDEKMFEQMKSTNSLLRPDDIAEAYWFLHSQKKSAWTFELDLRPWDQTFAF